MTSGGTARCRSGARRLQRPRAPLTPARSSPSQNPACALRARRSTRMAATTTYRSEVRRSTSVAIPVTISARTTAATRARRATSGHSLQWAARANRCTLAALRRSLAENSLRAKHQDRGQNREDERLGPLGPGAVPGKPLVERLDQADQDGAQDRSREISDAAQDRRRKCEQAELEAGVEADRRRIEGEDDSARARQCTGDEECERDRPVDVDPHHCRSVFVLRRGTHRLALARVLDEPDQAEEDRDGDEQNEQPGPGVDDVTDPEDLSTIPCRKLVGRQMQR